MPFQRTISIADTIQCIRIISLPLFNTGPPILRNRNQWHSKKNDFGQYDASDFRVGFGSLVAFSIFNIPERSVIRRSILRFQKIPMLKRTAEIHNGKNRLPQCSAEDSKRLLGAGPPLFHLVRLLPCQLNQFPSVTPTSTGA